MALSNVNQILLRNIDLLEGSKPLLINLDAEQLMPHWQEHYPSAEITCFNNNFGQYKAIKNQASNSVSCHFGSHYVGKESHDLVVIAFPKSKPELAYTLAMIAPYVTDETCIVFVGENKGGIKSVAKQSADYIEYCIKQDSARHCLIFSGRFIQAGKTFNLEDWFSYYEVNFNQQTIKVAALPGVFSQKGLDKGTKVLLEHLPNTFKGDVLDFGCGAGIISAAIAKSSPDTHLTLIDISALAIASSQETLRINHLNGKCIASDGLSEITQSFDQIVSNPPFHQGLKTHYAATELFLSRCSEHIKPQGQLVVVANSFLQYQPIMESSLGPTERLVVENGFTVYLTKKAK